MLEKIYKFTLSFIVLLSLNSCEVSNNKVIIIADTNTTKDKTDQIKVNNTDNFQNFDENGYDKNNTNLVDDKTGTIKDDNTAKDDNTSVAFDRTKIHFVDIIALANAENKSVVEYLTSEFKKKDKDNFIDGDQNIFSTKGTVFATDTWAAQFDFSGVGWDHVKAGTLITNQHIVVAAHYARSVGSTIKFLNKDGIIEERKIVALKTLKKYDSELGDACVEKLDKPVSDKVKVYAIPKSDITNDLKTLDGAPYIMTDQVAKAYPEKIKTLKYLGNEKYSVYYVVNWGKNSDYPNFMYHAARSGDSGNPHFLYANGELVLGSVLFGYGDGGMVSHFYGFKLIQDAINQAIEDMKDI